jgi:hypothetical protein
MCACLFEAAQGVLLLCPLCFERNGGEVGTHTVLIWFADRGIEDHWRPLPRWRVSGTGFEDLTLSPSIAIGQPCGWHGFVQGGIILTV